MQEVLVPVLAFASVFAVIAVTILIMRKVFWLFSIVFLLVDELTWFLYNPLRPFMKNREWAANRVFFYLFTIFLVKPLWQVGVWIITFPLRIITALYFDVLLYLFVMLSDSLSELANPKLGAMRFTKGYAYYWRWVAFLPKRLAWFLYKNALAVVDAVLMFLISLAWPTFTMYHGTAKDSVVDITRKGRWLVGPGNYGGSGIYFGRSPEVAIAYANGSRHKEGRVIIARVTLTMLRNCATLRAEHRRNVANPGEGGKILAQSIGFPYYATEFWNSGSKWWEYCILQGGKDGQHVSSWRIRPIGFVRIDGGSIFRGELERLWGGQSHYCSTPLNIAIAGLSLYVVVFLIRVWARF